MAHPPLELYRERIGLGAIDHDQAQEDCALALNRLYFELVQNFMPQKNTFQNFKQNFFAKQIITRGAYLYGPVGRGKSMLMDLLYQSIPLGIKKRRVHFHQFMLEVHDFLHARRRDMEGDDVVDQALPAFAKIVATRCKLLCFDEFHVTDIADAMILSRLFQAMFAEGIAIVSTSNWPPDDLYLDGLQRDRFLPFIDFIKKNMDVFHLDSATDYRARTLRELSVYFSPLNAISSSKADDLFHALTEMEEGSPDLIMVKGRTIEVPVTAKGVARFGFHQLCDRPLGAEDYLAIAKRYHTIFLEDIPRMGYDRRNEAKRLMILVDILYDHHRNLIITAEDTPQKLYIGHDHEFEFQRTISRLLEMQSPDYFARGKVG
jgi:cell division protein ZapE